MSHLFLCDRALVHTRAPALCLFYWAILSIWSEECINLDGHRISPIPPAPCIICAHARSAAALLFARPLFHPYLKSLKGQASAAERGCIIINNASFCTCVMPAYCVYYIPNEIKKISSVLKHSRSGERSYTHNVCEKAAMMTPCGEKERNSLALSLLCIRGKPVETVHLSPGGERKRSCQRVRCTGGRRSRLENTKLNWLSRREAQAAFLRLHTRDFGRTAPQWIIMTVILNLHVRALRESEILKLALCHTVQLLLAPLHAANLWIMNIFTWFPDLDNT